MGMIFKCDRCGSAYDEDTTICIEKTSVNKEMDSKLIKKYDLCPECASDLVKFKKNEEITTKPSLQQILEAAKTIEMDSPAYRGIREYMPAVYHTAERKKEDDEWMY